MSRNCKRRIFCSIFKTQSFINNFNDSACSRYFTFNSENNFAETCHSYIKKTKWYIKRVIIISENISIGQGEDPSSIPRLRKFFTLLVIFKCSTFRTIFWSWYNEEKCFLIIWELFQINLIKQLKGNINYIHVWN